MDLFAYIVPLLGAVALEVVHWYELRERLHLPKYRKLLRSWFYWVPTITMIFVGSGVVMVWNLSQDESRSAIELLVAGAAAPNLLKKFVAAFLAKKLTMLGDEDDDNKLSFRDYFIPA